jgi:hypothetical protein
LKDFYLGLIRTPDFAVPPSLGLIRTPDFAVPASLGLILTPDFEVSPDLPAFVGVFELLMTVWFKLKNI